MKKAIKAVTNQNHLFYTEEYTEGPLLSLHRDIPAAASDWCAPCTSDAAMDCDATEAAPTVAELPKTVREASKKTRS